MAWIHRFRIPLMLGLVLMIAGVMILTVYFLCFESHIFWGHDSNVLQEGQFHNSNDMRALSLRQEELDGGIDRAGWRSWLPDHYSMQSLMSSFGLMKGMISV
jgi:hypothetical protein